MLNGQIGGLDPIGRGVNFALDPALYRVRQGPTDSGTLSFLALTLGLGIDPKTRWRAPPDLPTR